MDPSDSISWVKKLLNLIKIQIDKRCDSDGCLTVSYPWIKFVVCLSHEYVPAVTLSPQICSVLDSVMGWKTNLGCLLFLEEWFKAAYIYTSVDVSALYSDGAIYKHVCDCVGYFLGSTQILYGAFNFYEDLVAKGVIIKYHFLIFS